MIIEKEHLRPLRNSVFRQADKSRKEKRKVSRDSYIMVGGTEYSVPLEYREVVVHVYETSDTITVFDVNTEAEIARHDKSPVKGRKIALKGHFRESGKSLEILQKRTEELFDSPGWSQFFQANQKKFVRYRRDQCLDALRFFSTEIDQKLLKDALEFCLQNETLSYRDLYDSYKHQLDLTRMLASGCALPENPFDLSLHREKYKSVNVEERSLSEYAEVYQGDVCNP